MPTSYVAFTPGIPKELLRRGLSGAWGKRLATVLGTKKMKNTVRKMLRVIELISIMAHKMSSVAEASRPCWENFIPSIESQQASTVYIHICDMHAMIYSAVHIILFKDDS